MKRVLFVTQSYPSKFSANVLCDDMIIRHLLATRDVEVHCLCMKYCGENTEDVVNGVYVHRFTVGPYFEWRFETLDKPGNMSYRLTRALDKVFLRLGQALTTPLYPCYHPIRFLQYVYRAAALQKRFQFDVVACEHYGTECLLTGMYLKKRWPNVRYIQLFWDALSGGMSPGYLPRRFASSRKERLERSVFCCADISVAMTSHRHNLMNKSYCSAAVSSGALKFMGIPYLKDSTTMSRSSETVSFDKSRINFVFAGNLWKRNLEFIASVIACFPGNNAVLWIITSSDIRNAKSSVSRYGNCVRFVPYVKHDELQLILSQADVLVNMGVDNPNAISGKVIEYVGFCKPIVSTYAIDDEACIDVLRDYPKALLIDERRTDIECAASELAAFLKRCDVTPLTYDEVQRAYFNCTPEAYCRLFDLLLETETSHV